MANSHATHATASRRRRRILNNGENHDIPDVVIDRKNVRSQTLVMIDEQDSKGLHICIVDDAGYEALINDRRHLASSFGACKATVSSDVGDDVGC